MRWNHKIVTLTVLLAIGITMVGLWGVQFHGWKHSGFHGKHDIFGGAKNGSTPNARCFTE